MLRVAEKNGLKRSPQILSLQIVITVKNVTVVVYRESSGINNKDHLVHYSYRNDHLPSGEIGVTVKNF